MKVVRLGWTMLRYRVAALLLPFYLLGAALHGALTTFDWLLLPGLLTLLSSYVVATALNDLSDVDVDRINHPHGRGRPLVTGDATPRDLKTVVVAAAAVCVISASVLGLPAELLVAGSLLLNVAYSVRPLRLSYRTWLAPAVLAIAYVGLPYGMGLVAVSSPMTSADAGLVGAFTVLFCGRMLLKDFRDRAGDAKHGKRSFLLRYGKTATCAATAALVVLGDALFAVAVPQDLRLEQLVLQAMFIGVGIQLWRLWRASGDDGEQVAIGIGAKFGNGVLLTLLGLLVMRGAVAGTAEELLFCGVMCLAYWFHAVMLEVQPKHVVLAYRG